MDKKPFWQSWTVWGTVLVLLPKFLKVVDFMAGTKFDNPALDDFCTTTGAYIVGKSRLDKGDLTIK